MRFFAFSIGGGFGGHTIFFVSPAAKVYQLAAFGTERAVRIILPFGGFATVRTLLHAVTSDSGRLMRILRLTNSIIPSRRMAFKRTVTLSRVEPTIEAISRCGSGMSISTPFVSLMP